MAVDTLPAATTLAVGNPVILRPELYPLFEHFDGQVPYVTDWQAGDPKVFIPNTLKLLEGKPVKEALFGNHNADIVLEVEGPSLVGRTEDSRGIAHKIRVLLPLIFEDGKLSVDIPEAPTLTATPPIKILDNVISIDPTLPLPGYLYGLNTSNNPTDPVYSIDIQPGQATDSTGTATIVLDHVHTKSMNGPFVAGSSTSHGGRQSNQPIAVGTWHIYLIDGPSVPPDAMFSMSIPPALPPGYTVCRRIWSFMHESGIGNYRYTQVGDTCIFNDGYRIFANGAGDGATAQNSPQLFYTRVPTGISVEVWIRGLLTSSDGSLLDINSPLAPHTSPSGNHSSLTFIFAGTPAGLANFGEVRVQTDTLGRVRVQTHVNACYLYAGAIGYTDTRGK